MGLPHDRILIIESEHEISDLIGRQVLQPLGYQVQVVANASDAVARAVQFHPDLVIMNLKMPGLSGKDLLVALAAQGVQVPVIVIASKGMEGDVIQAFRLGANDYLSWPAREPAILSAVERVLKQVRERREREALSRQLQQTAADLQARVHELTAVANLNKAIIHLGEPQAVYEKILKSCLQAGSADLGWFLLRDSPTQPFILQAQVGLPTVLAARLGQAWDDGLSELVAASGESYLSSGDSLKRFKLSTLGQSILVVPVKIRKQVAALLVLMRKNPQPFTSSQQNILEAITDTIIIALENARTLQIARQAAKKTPAAADLPPAEKHKPLAAVNLNDASRQALARFHRAARQNGLTLTSGLASPPVIALGDPTQVAQVLDGLLSNAIKFSRPGGQIILETGRSSGDQPYLCIQDSGTGITQKQLAKLFEAGALKAEPVATFPAGNGADLYTIKEIVSGWGANIQAESQPGKGASFRVSLQPAKQPGPAPKKSQ